MSCEHLALITYSLALSLERKESSAMRLSVFEMARLLETANSSFVVYRRLAERSYLLQCDVVAAFVPVVVVELVRPQLQLALLQQ